MNTNLRTEINVIVNTNNNGITVSKDDQQHNQPDGRTDWVDWAPSTAAILNRLAERAPGKIDQTYIFFDGFKTSPLINI